MFQKIAKGTAILREEGLEEFAQEVINHINYQYKQIMGPVREFLQKKLYRYRYGTAMSPQYKLISVCPTNITHLVIPQFREDHFEIGSYIRGGDWDQRYTDEELVYLNKYEKKFDRRRLIPFENLVLHESMKSHFIDDVAWEDTEFYGWIMRHLGETKYYESEDKIWDRFEQLDQLYIDMAQDGYRTQSELQSSSTTAFTAKTDPCPEFHEVRVNIGREGELLFEDGRHRLTIAKLLGIPSIPVYVFVRHKDWQKKRNRIAEAETITDLDDKYTRYLSHPDMQDLLPKPDTDTAYNEV